jgi:uncharacterized protein with HEPN domain
LIDARIETWLLKMREASLNALSFVDGLILDDFLQDNQCQHAVVMCLLNVGEAASRALTYRPALAVELPNISWIEMIGMRNRVAHGYWKLSLILFGIPCGMNYLS